LHAGPIFVLFESRQMKMADWGSQDQRAPFLNHKYR